MEIMQIQDSYIGIMQIFATMLLEILSYFGCCSGECLMPTSMESILLQK